MKIYEQLISIIEQKGAAYLILIDPDNIEIEKLNDFVSICENSGVDGFLIGGSLLVNTNLDNFVKAVKSATNLPAIIFPGSVNQVSPFADAILFLSLISGRNPEHLIGKQVIAAPIIKQFNIEPLSTGYMLIESGKTTTAEYMSESKPIPRDKPEIAAATALAAQYMGMKFIYLESGSGAELTVPNDIINLVSKTCDIPIIVGGGIRNSETALEKVKNGAKIIITGNFFEKEQNWKLIKDFASAIHYKDHIIV